MIHKSDFIAIVSPEGRFLFLHFVVERRLLETEKSVEQDSLFQILDDEIKHFRGQGPCLDDLPDLGGHLGGNIDLKGPALFQKSLVDEFRIDEDLFGCAIRCDYGFELFHGLQEEEVFNRVPLFFVVVIVVVVVSMIFCCEL